MKKVFALLLALVLVLSLVACGGGEKKEDTSADGGTTEAAADEYSKDSLMAIANDSHTQVYEVEDIMNETSENKAKAQQKYCDEVYVVSGWVYEIETDHIIINGGRNWTYQILVYLPTEEIVDLEQWQKIDIVGHFTSDIATENKNFGEFSEEVTYFTMDKAYFIKDHYEIRAKLMGKNTDYSPAYNAIIPPDAEVKVARLVYFRDGEESKLSGKDTDNLTLEAKKFYQESGLYTYKDAVIVE